MNRRNFLSLAALAVAGKAAQRVWPFRVYSIPKEIVVAPNDNSLSLFGISTAIPEGLLCNGPFMNLSRIQFPLVANIYNGAGDFLRGSVKIESVKGKIITCDALPAGCVPGDTIMFQDVDTPKLTSSPN